MERKTTRRVLYIGAFQLPDKNAAAHRVIGIAKAMRSLGYIVEFLDVSDDCESQELSPMWKTEGFTVYSQHHAKSLKEKIKYSFQPLHLEEVLRKHSDWYAVIAYNYPAFALNKARSICREYHAFLLTDCTEWYFFMPNSLSSFLNVLDSELRMRSVQKKVDGVIAISTFLGDYYKDIVPTVVIPPTIDAMDEKWKKNENSVGKQEDEYIDIIYAGSTGKEKDKLSIVIHSVNKCSEKKKIRFKILGMNQEQYLKQYSDDVKIVKHLIEEGRLEFLGRLSHLDTIQNVKNSDYCVFYRENTLMTRAGFPTKFVESISCGTPVITTRTSDLYDYINTNGFVLAQKEFSTKLIEILEHEEENNIKVDRTLFDYHNFTHKLERFFMELEKKNENKDKQRNSL